METSIIVESCKLKFLIDLFLLMLKEQKQCLVGETELEVECIGLLSFSVNQARQNAQSGVMPKSQTLADGYCKKIQQGFPWNFCVKQKV
jgi:hypothetical protein